VGHAAADVRFTQVAAGGHTCGVASGQVPSAWCWGRNSSDGGGGHGTAPVPDAGQLGHSGPGNGPARVQGDLDGLTVTSVATGRYHSVAAAGGRVFTWGLNDQGQLGRGATTVPHPVRILRCLQSTAPADKGHSINRRARIHASPASDVAVAALSLSEAC
jgi:Regulator of chromosome condensation (RCC1) repeat